jgi:hypothetical protein
MSGPIVRKYGFPNFEKIFGERELKHGTDEGSSSPDTTNPPAGQPQADPLIGPEVKPEAEPRKS